jgi:hypothetical protein
MGIRKGKGGGGGGGGGSLADMGIRKGAGAGAGAGTPKGPTSLAAVAAGGAGPQVILGKLRAELKSRGASGIVGLGRKFRIMDDDGSKSLNMAEFKKAMRECK